MASRPNILDIFKSTASNISNAVRSVISPPKPKTIISPVPAKKPTPKPPAKTSLVTLRPSTATTTLNTIAKNTTGVLKSVGKAVASHPVTPLLPLKNVGVKVPTYGDVGNYLKKRNAQINQDYKDTTIALRIPENKQTPRQKQLARDFMTASVGGGVEVVGERAGASLLSKLANKFPSVSKKAQQIVEKAQQFDPEFKKSVQDVADAIGANVVHGNVKKVARVAEKAKNDYGGDVGKVKDLNRSVLLTDPSKLESVIKAVEDKFGAVVRVKNDMSGSGYGKIILNVPTPHGIGEIQLTTPEMWNAKKTIGDRLYNTVRAKRQGWEDAARQMNQLYDDARAASTSRLASSSETSLPSANTLNGGYGAPVDMTVPNTSSVLGSNSILTGTSSTSKNLGNDLLSMGESPFNNSVPQYPTSGQVPPVQTGTQEVYRPPQEGIPQSNPPGYPSSPSSPGNIPPEESPVNKIIAALKEAKPIRGSQEAMYSQERGRRIGKAIAVGQNTSGKGGFLQQLGQMKGELPKADYESIANKVTPKDVDQLFNQLKDSPHISEWEKLSAGQGLLKIVSEHGGGVPTEGELKLLNQVYGKDFTDAVLSKRTLLQKGLNLGEQVLNIPRTLMSSVDFSAALRQGVFAAPSHPKTFGKAFAGQFKQAFSEKAFQEAQQAIKQRPTYDLMKQHGLALTDAGTGISSREEAFASNLAEKIPLVGRLVRGSERGYIGFLNKFRADLFDDLLKNNPQLQDNAHALSQTADLINNMTGRGKLPSKALEKAAPLLNGVLFSPRLMASRINLLNPLYYANQDPTVRKEAIKSLLGFAGTGMSILGLAKLSGADVSTDPRNADFGKIKVGNTRYDIWGGFQQYVKLAAQLVTGKLISSTTGKEISVGEGYKPMTRGDILLRSIEGKEAPVASLITDLLRGKTLIGEDLNVKNQAIDRVLPMAVGDFVDAYNEWGAKGIPMAAPSLLGVGAQTYGGTPVSLEEAKQRGDVDLYRYLRSKTPDEANKYINSLPDDSPELKKLQKFKKLEDSGLGVNEWRMVGTSVKSGERAKLITNQLNTLQTKQQKNDYINKLNDAGLLTDEVYNQLADLKNKGQLKAPSDMKTSPLPASKDQQQNILPVFQSRQALPPTESDVTTQTDQPDSQVISDTPEEYKPVIEQAASDNQVPASLLSALLKQESGFNPDAHNPSGATGIAQFMPGTAAGLGIDPSNPDQAIPGAAQYLKKLYDKYGSWELALAAYNAGSGNVDKYGGIPPFAETQNYVRSIMSMAGL